MFVSQQTAAAGASANAIVSGLLARQRALAPFQQALRGVPIEQKVEYLEALRVAPRLIDTEADPLFFLEFAGFDASKAASRFVEYWRKRRQIYAERAFLPLDLSGNGAMSLEDIEYVKQGIFAVLGNDSQGCPVFLADREKGNRKQFSFKCHIRAYFFFWSIMFRNPKSRTEGFVSLVQPLKSWMTQDQMAETINVLENAVPLRIKAMHMLYLREEQTLIQQFIPWLRKYLGKFVSKSLIMHNFDSSEQLIHNLGAYGISRENLPSSVGGTWSYEHDFPRFLIQHGLPISLLDLNSTAATAQQLHHPLPSIQKATLNALTGGPAVAFRTTSSLINANGPSSPLLSSVTPASNRASLEASASPLVGAQSTNHGEDDWLFTESATVKERGLASLKEAMRLLPDEEKAAYFEAIRRAPHLVEKESNPLKYLRFEKFNAWAAAKRLACYWKYRVNAFQDRAFQPLTQTPGGALQATDIEAIRTGYFSFLDPDSSGRTVLCYDTSKRKAETLQTRMRVTFYIFSIISENERSLRDGYVSLLLLGSSSFGSTQLDGSMQANINIAVDAFPIRLEKLHIVYPRQQMGGPFSFMSHILPFIMKVLGRVIDPKTEFHVGDTEEELHRKMESYGIKGSSLPQSLGGSVKDSDFVQWMKNRELLELRSYGQTILATDGASTGGNYLLNDEVVSSPAPTGILQASAQDVHSVIELLPGSERTAYIEATQLVPELVRKESDPTRFLRAANFDNLAAARWLARYWKIRKEIFGDRTYLPMDQTGDGALERKDVSVLQTGYLTQLPDDMHGRSVICCDGSRLQKSSPVSRLRCTFYIWSCISENEKSQTEGYSVLYVITEPSFDRANKECLNLAMQALPVKLKAFHLLGCPPEDTTEDSYLEGQVQSTLELLDPSIQSRVVIDTCASRSQFIQKLAPHGISKHGLPRTLGGSWGFQEFVQWQELRIRHEWALPIGAGTRDAAHSFHIPTGKVPADLTEEEKNERKRRMNVIHSRRKRERERIEVEGLSEQCTEMREENKKLASEGRRLKQLLDNAKEVVKEA